MAYKKGEEAVVQEYFHGRKVFVGGLTKEATEDKLREYFGAYGTVRRKLNQLDGFVLPVFMTGGSRGHQER